MINHNNTLPNGFVINGYFILSLEGSTDLYNIYEATDPAGSRVDLIEFFPNQLAVRDSESHKVRYADDENTYQQLMVLKNQFDQEFSPQSQLQMSELGTVFYIKNKKAVISPVSNQPQLSSLKATPQQPIANRAFTKIPVPAKKKKSAAAPIFLLAILGAGAYFGYDYFTSQSATEKESNPAPTEEKPKLKSDSKTSTISKEKEASIPKIKPVQDTTQEPREEIVVENHNEPTIVTEKEPEVPETKEEDVVTLNLEDFNNNKSSKKGNNKSSKADPSAISAFIKQYAKPMPLNQWKSQYENVEQGWFNTDDEQFASRYITTFGPLGIRAVQLDKTWNQFSNFKSLYPKELLDADGNMCINMYKVTNVISGSPADKHIEEGDYIIAIDKEPFQSASSMKLPYGPYINQNKRGLDLHAGLLLDKAEGKGSITLTVIKPKDLPKFDKMPNFWEQVQRVEKVQEPVEVSVKLKPNESIQLIVDDGGNGIGSDGFDWEDVKFTGPKGTINLTANTQIDYSVGYGASAYNEKTKSWPAHASSTLAFKAPAQGEWTFHAKGIKGGAASVGVTVKKGGMMGIPEPILKLAKNVNFKIPKIGTFAEGFPKNCSKSKAIVTMLCEWLLAQQKENGSWDRPGGYCDNNYDTAMAALAMMATGDPKYNDAIKKAAHYVAFGGAHSWWSVPQAQAGVFLCEYYLRFKDTSVLPAISNGVKRMKSEVLYGDFVTGHGIHPGYAGTGVSIGGSSMTLFLALASKTPARVEDGVLEKMLDKAQELCPTGMGPYGRKTERFTFDPDMECGGSYSGRHGPYYLASRVVGGPALYVKNSNIMYGKGPSGGSDQGHSSETLSVISAFPSFWFASPEAYYREMESFRWKMTLLRSFDSGMVYNPNRTELMTADGVLGIYIRTAAWVIALCADRENLAITGKPEHKAKKFRDVPAVLDTESRFYQTSLRNWSLASAALGANSPASLKSAIAEMKKIPVKQGCRYPVLDIMKEKAPKIAKDILALSGVNELTKAYCAEMILGVNVMINLEPENGGFDSFKYCFEIQRPFSGKNYGLRDNQERSANDQKYVTPFSGEIKIEGGSGLVPFDSVTWDQSSKFGGDWDVFKKEDKINGSDIKEPKELTANIKMKIGDVKIEYKRPLTIGSFEVGCGEKTRSVANDRTLWVPGKLIQDHGNWGCSFRLIDGTYISAASQGNQIWVQDNLNKDKKTIKWVTPNDATLTKGSQAMFKVATDWYGFECRVPEVKLVKPGSEILDYRLNSNNSGNIKTDILTDKNAMTFEEIPIPKDGVLELSVNLANQGLIRAVDIKLLNGHHKIEVEAYKGGKWIPVYWGSVGAATHGENAAVKQFYQNDDITRASALPGNGFPKNIRNFNPIQTNKLRIKVHGGGSIKLSELHVYKEEDSGKK